MNDLFHSLVPPLFGMQWLLVDSPTRSGIAYRKDKQWFTEHPRRRFRIRQEWPFEFDAAMVSPEKITIPRLQVLVARVSVGTHLIAPIYRGTPEFNVDVDADEEISSLLADMAHRSFLNRTELEKFLEMREAHCALHGTATMKAMGR